MARDIPREAPIGCCRLDWDSTFFGRTIARIEPRALLQDGATVDAWCRRVHVNCAYMLADADDQAAIDAAQAFEFRLIDVRVTLETGLPAVPAAATPVGEVRVRPAAPSDLDALKRIARVSHRNTRFYVDDRFDRARCDELYEVWITKSCGGWADAVVVADIAGTAAGYLTCHRRPDGGEIGLVGVDPDRRGAGAGAAMTADALRWFASQGISRVSVVTQGRNTAGLRMYQKAGFAVRSIQLWYHKWW